MKILFFSSEPDEPPQDNNEVHTIDDDEKEKPTGLFTILAYYPNEFVVYCLASALMLGIGFMLVY